MRESLLTIPVNEVFEPRKGCPICAMRDVTEDHVCDYIMGAAMMEPDVRIETNELGFCREHLNDLLGRNNRLSLALMLDTRLAEIQKVNFGKPTSPKAWLKDPPLMSRTCFVCSKVDWGVAHTLETMFKLFKDSEEFRALYSKQEYICIPHYEMLMSAAPHKLKKDDLKAFCDETDRLCVGYLKKLNEDVNTFCNSFDYRNAGKLHSEEMEHVRNSIERAAEFLTSRKPEPKKPNGDKK